MELARLTEFFETMTPASLDRLGEFYAADARFKDPFNEVCGVSAIARIFAHLFDQLEAPRFVVGETATGPDGAFLTWELHGGLRLPGRSPTIVIRGATHLRFDADGKITEHRDYWDAAEELYSKLPVLGSLMWALRRHLAARA